MLSQEEIRAIKRANPLPDLAGRRGITLRRNSRSYVGRCPFHDDGGRPNLSICCASDAADDFFHCFRCGAGGDVIRFVRLLDNVGFGEAIAQLEGPTGKPHNSSPRPSTRRLVRERAWGGAERSCLAAAVTLYHNSLLDQAAAVAYLKGRGIEQPTVDRCRIGYATGGELARYLRWRRLPLRAAYRVGLLRAGGAETFAGRIVVPEIRAGQPVWLIGRLVDEPGGDQPKYLGLPGRGRKPLLGWEGAAWHACPVVVESVFDWLTLVSWDIAGLALMGTGVSSRVLASLSRFASFFLALNTDEAGRQATQTIVEALGRRAIPVELPGVKDVSELAALADGRQRFLELLEPWQRRAAA